MSQFRNPNINENRDRESDDAWKPYVVEDLRDSQTPDELRASLDSKFQYAQLQTESDGGIQMKTRLRYTECNFWKMLEQWMSFFSKVETCPKVHRKLSLAREKYLS